MLRGTRWAGCRPERTIRHLRSTCMAAGSQSHCWIYVLGQLELVLREQVPAWRASAHMVPPQCFGVADVMDFCEAQWSGSGKNRLRMLWARRFAAFWFLKTHHTGDTWLEAACREFPLAQPYLLGTYLEDNDGEDLERHDRLLRQGIV